MENKPIVFESASIFSIIGSSIGFLVMFLSAFFFDSVVKIITELTNITATEKLDQLYFVLLGTSFCISLIGAIKLYRMQRNGLILYVAAQIFILFVPVFWIGSNAFSATNAIFTMIFSGIYIYYHKLLKV